MHYTISSTCRSTSPTQMIPLSPYSVPWMSSMHWRRSSSKWTAETISISWKSTHCFIILTLSRSSVVWMGWIQRTWNISTLTMLKRHTWQVTVKITLSRWPDGSSVKRLSFSLGHIWHGIPASLWIIQQMRSWVVIPLMMYQWGYLIALGIISLVACTFIKRWCNICMNTMELWALLRHFTGSSLHYTTTISHLNRLSMINSTVSATLSCLYGQ